MAYGLKQFDENGDEMLDTSTAVTSLIKIDTIAIYTYRNASYGPTSVDYSLTGVTSQQDLEDNYILSLSTGGEWNAFSSYYAPDGLQVISYVSPGLIRFTSGTSSCYDFWGNPTVCNEFNFDLFTYQIFAVGKTL
tara:strand:- start:1607 stop:2011 length:405 start_codon:yes stop_codon:yes gene_type:complete